MSIAGNGRPIRYSLVISKATSATLKQLREQAFAAGIAERFMQAIRRIVERLQRDPIEFGERLYYLPALKLVVYQAVIEPVVVTYGVYEEKPLVFVRRFHVLS